MGLKLSWKIDAHGCSDIGLVRQHNEDVWRALFKERLFLLADGMGGCKAGEVAALHAVEALAEWATQLDNEERLRFTTSQERIERWRSAVAQVNLALFQESESLESLRGMGTTLCLLALYEEEAVVLHVGDSRVYCLRKGALLPLTRDHSLLNELLASGELSPEQALLFPFKHVVTRALATQATIEPEIRTFPLEEEDLFLLCSDGLTNYVSEEALERVLRQEAPLQEKADHLIRLAKEAGGGDNVTVVLVQLSK